MRLGVCLLTLASGKDPLARALIPTVKRAGYDYAEVPLARLLDLPDDEFAEYRGEFLRNGLPVEAFNNAIPSGLPMIGPDRCEEVLRRYIDRAVFLADRMGVRVITMCGPIRSWVPAGFCWEEGFAQYTAFMQMYADAAAARGIVLAVEPINSEEDGFISTVAEARRVIAACGRNNITAVVDFYHFFKENDDWEALLQSCGDISHVHYAAQARRSYPLAGDAGECRRVLAPFLQAGYTGRISIEAHTGAPEQDLPETCALMRSVLG